MAEFPRPQKEDYGPSSVRLEKLDMTKEFCRMDINGTEIVLPVLNLRKYNQGAECYAFVETLQNYPITLVDILYSYQDILYRFENDERFRREFLNVFRRRQINISSHISPALTVIPNRADVANDFAIALKSALQDALGTQIVGFSRTQTKDKEIEELPPEGFEEGIVMEFIKDFYEIISGKKVKRSTDPIKRTVTYSLKKEAILMKSGVAVIESEVVDKYFTTFRAEIKAEESQMAKDSLSIYVSGIDEELLMTSPEYLDEFETTLLESNVLEAFAYLNPKKLPKMNYSGRYNESKHKLVIYKKIENYFDELNRRLLPQKNDAREER